MEKIKKICIVCGTEFETDNMQKKVCSVECRKKRDVQNVAAARQRKREELNPLLKKKSKQFNSFGDFCAWAHKMLAGGVVERYTRFRG
jgi:hypothetical protein